MSHRFSRVNKVCLAVFALLLLSACGGGGEGSSGEVQDAVKNASSVDESTGKLGWPVACELGKTCAAPIGYPDIDGDWVASNCEYPGYLGHIGTDISNIDYTAGTDVLAAADGVVAWVLDGKFDDCVETVSEHPDCLEPSLPFGPNVSSGYMSCTESREEYCEGSGYSGGCYWCTYGANQVVIRHHDVPGVFATTYDHLKLNSIVVRPGEHVLKGQKIAEIGSAGKSTGPHLHFGVWGTGYGQLVDPWAGECSITPSETLWDAGIQEAAAAADAAAAAAEEVSWVCDEDKCTYTGGWE